MFAPNGLPASQTLAAFIREEEIVCLEISPVRDIAAEGTDGTEISVTEPALAQFWSIYGVGKDGFHRILHDCTDPAMPAGKALVVLSIWTGLPVCYSSAEHVGSLTGTPIELCEWLTETIHDEIPDGEDDDARMDDFDAHPLADLREALAEASGYDGHEPMWAHESEAQALNSMLTLAIAEAQGDLELMADDPEAYSAELEWSLIATLHDYKRVSDTAGIVSDTLAQLTAEAEEAA